MTGDKCHLPSGVWRTADCRPYEQDDCLVPIAWCLGTGNPSPTGLLLIAYCLLPIPYCLILIPYSLLSPYLCILFHSGPEMQTEE